MTNLDLSSPKLIDQKVINLNWKVFYFVTFCHFFDINVSKSMMTDKWIDQWWNLVILS